MPKAKIRMLSSWGAGFVVAGLLLAGVSTWLTVAVGLALLTAIFTLIRD